MKLRRSGVRERGFGELGYLHRMRLLHGWPADAFESQELELLAWAEHRSALLEESHAGLPWAFWVLEVGELPPREDDPRMAGEPPSCGPTKGGRSGVEVHKARLGDLGLPWPKQMASKTS